MSCATNTPIDNRLRIVVVDTGLAQKDMKQPYLCKEGVFYTSFVTKQYDEIGHGKSITDIIAQNMDMTKYCITPIVWYDRGVSNNNTGNSLIEALQIANKLKPHIVNLSLSGRNYNPRELFELRDLLASGAYVNVASGNDSLILTKEECEVYPTCYNAYFTPKDRKRFIPVTSNDLPSSNQGYGVKAFRTGYGLDGLKGTSQATAWYTNSMVRKND